jgi:hypothetical protein
MGNGSHILFALLLIHIDWVWSRARSFVTVSISAWTLLWQGSSEFSWFTETWSPVKFRQEWKLYNIWWLFVSSRNRNTCFKTKWYYLVTRCCLASPRFDLEGTRSWLVPSLWRKEKLQIEPDSFLIRIKTNSTEWNDRSPNRANCFHLERDLEQTEPPETNTPWVSLNSKKVKKNHNFFNLN